MKYILSSAMNAGLTAGKKYIPVSMEAGIYFYTSGTSLPMTSVLLKTSSTM